MQGLYGKIVLILSVLVIIFATNSGEAKKLSQLNKSSIKKITRNNSHIELTDIQVMSDGAVWLLGYNQGRSYIGIMRYDGGIVSKKILPRMDEYVMDRTNNGVDLIWMVNSNVIMKARESGEFMVKKYLGVGSTGLQTAEIMHAFGDPNANNTIFLTGKVAHRDNSSAPLEHKLFVSKLDYLGRVEWSKFHESSILDEGINAYLWDTHRVGIGDGEIVVAGVLQEKDVGGVITDHKLLVLKLDHNGQYQESRELDFSLPHAVGAVKKVLVDNSGNVFIYFTKKINPSTYRHHILKLSSNLIPQWSRYINFDGNNTDIALFQDDSEIILTAANEGANTVVTSILSSGSGNLREQSSFVISSNDDGEIVRNLGSSGLQVYSREEGYVLAAFEKYNNGSNYDSYLVDIVGSDSVGICGPAPASNMVVTSGELPIAPSISINSGGLSLTTINHQVNPEEVISAYSIDQCR